jgi:anti-anti-sigma regulatory factor
VVVEAGDAFTHVVLRGRLDLTGVEEVEGELAKQIVARRKPVIVDISDVNVLASIGGGMLIKTARSLHSYGLIFGVVATGLGKETLERLKVDTIFPVVATYEQALRALMLE